MRTVILVGIGSFFGGAARFIIQQLVQSKWSHAFPFGTLAVNIAGCFIIGIVFSFGLKGFVNNDWRLFLATGICGGFTTFSAFSIESITFFRAGEWFYGLTYITVSILFGLLATFAGMLLIKVI
ncbi:MAG: fluoride efflux transporter CrcB [Bacteroidetes bacterium]|nr:fluoride efflux transporter CrcB [Bacteroidota bacterium]